MPTYSIVHHPRGERAETIISLKTKKEEARAYARGWAAGTYPGCTITLSNDCAVVMQGDHHVADVSVEPHEKGDTPTDKTSVE